MSSQVHEALDKALKGPLFDRRVRRRNLKDSLLGSGIKVGGVAIIAAVLLIMFFLIYVVGPLFTSAKVEEINHYAVPGGKEETTLYYGMDEYKTTALRFTQSGKLYGFNLQTGQSTTQATLPLKGQTITSFSILSDVSDLLAFGLSDGSVLFAKYSYKVSYPNNVKTITPTVEFPFGSETIALADGAITKLAVRANDSAVLIAFQEANSKNIHLKRLAKETSMFGDDVTLTEDTQSVFEQQMMPNYLMLDGSMRNLYLVNEAGVVHYYNIADLENPKLLQHVSALSGNEKISSIRFLLGEYSLLMGTNEGRVYQYFPVRNADNIFQLQLIRQFEKSNSPIEMITIEQGRKGFATIDGSGKFDLYHSTSERHLESLEVDEKGLTFVTLAPRSNGAVVETKDGQLKVFDIENEHPDVSMSSLWGKVWYEGYEEPSYTWQSSSASSDFEPKFSMVPLTFGTLKAALYSMLFAVPIAVLAAIYTAFFMDIKTRQWVKPSVELIEALPTVILGFLAGLWLAPHMEAHLSGYFAIILLVPLGVLLFGIAWSKLPEPIRLMVPEGKRAVLMVPVVGLLAYLALELNAPIENLFFDGDMRHWLTASAGIDFDQRNALVIGFAMGFALIPTIFSVAEDAIYNVPSYLVNGSLALGASTWQTMVGVVLPTASPGIFSAIMLGFGRGVGETMIVLMASGNTPLMDANIFEGMRTLSANLAVEMAEAEVYSSHYRVLFLSGLVLFIFTFMFNTLAEVVRERMRRKYGSL